MEFWHLANCENPDSSHFCGTVIRSTGYLSEHRLRLESSSTPYQQKPPGQDDYVIRWCKYAVTEYKASRARCFSFWKNIDVKKPLDALWGVVHLMTRAPFADYYGTRFLGHLS
jgi:hypothetical protein